MEPTSYKSIILFDWQDSRVDFVLRELLGRRQASEIKLQRKQELNGCQVIEDFFKLL